MTERYPIAEAEHTAESAINSAVDEAGSRPDAMLAKARENGAELGKKEQARVEHYVTGVRSALEGTVVNELEAGVGGVYDGKNIEIAKDILVVRTSIDDVIAQTEETSDHEFYHAEHDHTAPMHLGSSAQGETAVTIGGKKLTEEAVVEGLTVDQTGEKFVSQGYRQFRSEIRSALSSAGLPLSALEEAVNEKKDLRLVDDLDRKHAADKQYALGA